MPTNLVGRGCAGATTELKSLHVTATCPRADEIYSATVPRATSRASLYKGTVNPLAVPRGRASVVLGSPRGPRPRDDDHDHHDDPRG